MDYSNSEHIAPPPTNFSIASFSNSSPEIGAPKINPFLQLARDARAAAKAQNDNKAEAFEEQHGADNDPVALRLDTLCTLANYVGGTTFATKRGKVYYANADRRPLSEADLTAHARGRLKIAVYPMKPGSDQTSMAVLDFDDHGGVLSWQEMVNAARAVIAELKKFQIGPSLLVRSSGGRGIHIWLLFSRPVSAKRVRAFLTSVLRSCGFDSGAGGISARKIEVFPKQDALKTTEVGNPVGLPFAGKSAVLDTASFEPTSQFMVLTTIGTSSIPDVTGQKSSGSSNSSQSNNETRGFEAILSEIGDGPPPLDGFNSPLSRAAASYVAKNFEVLDEDKLKKLLRDAVDNAPKGPNRTDEEIKRYRSDKYLDGIIQSAKRKYVDEERGVKKEDFVAVMNSGNYLFGPTRDFWPPKSVNTRIKPIPEVKPDGSPVMVGKGKAKKAKTVKASQWLDVNRPVEQISWAPGKPAIIRDRLIVEGGWIERPGVAVYNLYRPPVIRIDDLGAVGPDLVGPWLDHIAKVYPTDVDHIVKWFAHRVQRPGDKINHALLLGGDPGIGKDSIIEPVKRAVGPWNVQEVAPHTILENQFNGYLIGVITRVSEARDLGEVDRHTFYERLKTMCAAPPDVHRINEKHLREYYAPNVNGMIITTNYLTNGVYLPPDDRRTYVAWSATTQDDFTKEYWDTLWRWYDLDGDRLVAAYLTQLDISDFNSKATPPKTEAFREIVSANIAPEENELLELFHYLENGEDAARILGKLKLKNLDAITIPLLVEIVSQLPMDNHFQTSDLHEYLTDRANRRAIPHKLARAGYLLCQNPDNSKEYWQVGKRQLKIYAKRTLSHHERIRAARALVKG